MITKHHFYRTILVFCVGLSFAAKSLSKDIISGIKHKSFLVKDDSKKTYFLIGPKESNEVPKDGFRLLVVIPDYDDETECISFIKQIYKKALSKEYLVAQLVPVKTTRERKFIWPTGKQPAKEQGFSTEEFIKDVVEDIETKYKLNHNYIFSFSWASGVPAALVVSLQKETTITGSYIVTSSHEPKNLPPLEFAKSRAYLIDYSPENSLEAYEGLRENGARVKLLKRKNGTNWKTDSFARIRYGIRRLEAIHSQPLKKAPLSAEKNVSVIDSDPNFLVEPLIDSDPNFLLEPLVGVGSIQFGMSKKEVIKYLGKPKTDKYAVIGDMLDYNSNRGLAVTVHPQYGVVSILCLRKAHNKHFAYITKKGVKMGATRTQIESVYGKAEQITKRNENSVLLNYDKKMRAVFMLRNGKLDTIMLLIPRPKQGKH